MMTGDYTKVPLRPNDRWTGARMQQGRVMFDHDLNLNIDAAARASRALASDVIGPAGVVAGSQDFRVGVTTSGTLDVKVHAGRIWVDGTMAHAPEDFGYLSQDQIEPLPTNGRALVYLDVFEQHVQPAEAGDALIDPALAPVDSTARTRIGYRVRCAPTLADTCQAAWEGLATAAGSTGTLTIDRVAPAAPADPCAPPGDPLGQLPDGLFRVEVIDPGGAGSARFAWSYQNGSPAVAVQEFAGDRVTLRPSAAVKFATGELVEVSWLARREDRVAHGALYTIAQSPETGAGGDILTLDRAVAAPADADGLVVRRWDGEATGAAATVSAILLGNDLGVRFRARAGDYVVGDAWCARVREQAGVGIELRVDAPADGVRHAFAPLALVDLGARQVLHDCRPTFVPLTAIKHHCGSCTVSAVPGDDLQAAVDSLPASGGELCLAAGLYSLPAPVRIAARRRVVVSGAGPATVLRATQTEAALIVRDSSQIEIRHVRLEGGSPGKVGDPGLNGALTVLASSEVTLSESSLSCPESPAGRAQTCVTVRSVDGRDPDRIRIERNRMRVGPWETGVLLVDVGTAVVAGNEISLAGDPEGQGVKAGGEPMARGLRSLIAAAVRPEAESGTKPVKVAGTKEPLHVLTGSGAEKLIAAIAARLTAAQVSRRGAFKALQAATVRVADGPARARLPKSAQAVIDQLQIDLRVVGQGIVAGGSRAGTIEIADNLIEHAVQGIHVGVSHADQAGREAADTVMIARNVVHALVPSQYDRDRHAVFVGNARSIHVVDTVATLERTGSLPFLRTPVEGIRIHGELGAFLTVRQSSLSGFRVGVRVVPLGRPTSPRMWFVAETMAAGATTAVDAPSTVQQERNSP
jgi:hypothetical protein